MAASLGNSSVEAQVSAQLARCNRATNCLREIEASVLQQHPGMAHRRGSALVLMLASGDSVAVHDTSMAHPLPPMPQDYFETYWLAGIDERAGYFLVGEDMYEWSGAVVVNRRTGWRHGIDFEAPVFSEDGKYAAAFIPFGFRDLPVALDVFAVTPDSLVREFTMEAPVGFELYMGGDTLWGPTPPRWVGHELRFRIEQTRTVLWRPCDYRDGCAFWLADSISVINNQGKWQLQRVK
jgi:hypothetical protein